MFDPPRSSYSSQRPRDKSVRGKGERVKRSFAFPSRLLTACSRRISIVTLALVFGMAVPGHAETVRVGIYENAPKIFRDAKGEPSGFWPELTLAILQDLGHQVVWVDCQWAECLELLELGEIDIMPDMAHSEERDARFKLVDHPALYAWSSILVGDSVSVNTIEDLNGLRIAVVEDSIQGEVLLDRLRTDFDQARVIEVGSMDETVQQLSSGKADAAIVNSFFARQPRRREDIHVAPIPFDVSTLHFALSPQSADLLLEALNLAIYEQQTTPGSAFRNAERRWITQQAPALPEWFHTAVAAVIVVLLLSFGMIVALRRTVRLRTARLEDSVTSLKAEIAQRKNAEAKVIEAQRIEALGRLVGGVAHDFNNMLAVIMGNLDMLRDEIRNARAFRLLEDAIRASERGASLTKQLLSFGRRASLKPEVLDISATMPDVHRIVSRVLPESIQVENDQAEGTLKTCVDPAQFESALLNLALNARDAMPNGGRLTIRTTARRLDSDSIEVLEADLVPGRYVVVSVSDTGHGMHPEVREKAVEPFFTTKEVGAGSGMGLAMVHGFMKQSNGGLRILTEPGAGTTVELYFKQTDIQSSAPSAQEAAPQTTASGRILMVEDDEYVRNTLLMQLENMGYQVTAVENGQAALERLTSGLEFDLLLTDVVMPGPLQGPGLADRVRERFPDLPVILMSGYAELEDAGGSGPRRDYLLLPKPVRAKDLREVLASKLAAKG